jgi:hypothetical protein
MKKLIFDQVDYFNNKISNTGCKTSISLSITHLDQTNECLVLDTGLVNYKDIRLDMFDKIYTSFGEKADDIIA